MVRKLVRTESGGLAQVCAGGAARKQGAGKQRGKQGIGRLRGLGRAGYAPSVCSNTGSKLSRLFRRATLVAAPGRPWRGSPLCPLGDKPRFARFGWPRYGGHPAWANTKQAAQHLVKLSIQRAAQPRVFRTVRARERSARSCQWFPSLLSKVMVQAGIAAHCTPRVFGTVRAREAQPDLKSQWVRLPRPKGVQKRHSL